MRVVVSGYYGFGNTGDEAVLRGLITALRRAGSVEITVLSGNPQETQALHGVEAVDRYSLAAIWKAFRRADLVISGGGGLLQDRTSARSSLYYLAVIVLAAAAGKPVYVYGQGVGPLRRRWLRRAAGAVLRRARGIGVRDEASRELLEACGIPASCVHVTADAAFALETPDPEQTKQALEAIGVAPGEPLIGVVWRWPLDPAVPGGAGLSSIPSSPDRSASTSARASQGSPFFFSSSIPSMSSPPARPSSASPASLGSQGASQGSAEAAPALVVTGGSSQHSAETGARDRYRQEVAQAVAALAKKLGARVVVIPFHPQQDQAEAEAFCQAVHEAGADALCVRRSDTNTQQNSHGVSERGGFRDPEHLLALVGGMDLVLTVRYHGLVFAALAGRPAVALAYDPKVRQLAEALGVPWLDPGEAPSRLSYVLEEAWHERASLGENLTHRAARFRERALAEGERALALASALPPLHQGSRVDVLGVGVDVVTAQEAVERLVELWEKGGSHQVVTLNPEMIMAARQDPRLKDVLRQSSLVVADGIGVVWASRVLGQALPERVAGVDLASAAIARAAAQGRTVALVGGKPGVAEEAAKRLQARHPSLRVTVTHHGYFTDAESDAVVAEIARQGVDLLLVGLGAPKQEFWIHQNLHRAGARVAMGVGGALDVFSGRVRRAPAAWQRLGLEWAYRLLQEPKRIRRMAALPRFVAAVLSQKWLKRGDAP